MLHKMSLLPLEAQASCLHPDFGSGAKFLGAFANVDGQLFVDILTSRLHFFLYNKEHLYHELIKAKGLFKAAKN